MSYKPSLEENVKRLRINIMIHSYLYYVLNESVIDDILYDKMCMDLVEHQKSLKVIGLYDDLFKDWDGSTGYHLCYDGYIIDKANYILHLVEKMK